MKTNTLTLNEVQKEFKSDPVRNRLISHPVFRIFKDQPLKQEQVATIVGQWYYPVQNFPFFLASCISHMENRSVQTFISDILHEELGCGIPSNSHLDLYISTCIDAGISEENIINSHASEATLNLINGYKKSAKQEISALGSIYATEVADLVMVSSVGAAIGNFCGKSTIELPWVDIHIEQEPNHVNNVESSLNVEFSDVEFGEILFSARSMWNLWIKFFDDIQKRIN